MTFYNIESLFLFFGLFSIIAGAFGLVYYRRLDASGHYWALATFANGVLTMVTVFRDGRSPFWFYSLPIALSVATNVALGLGIQRLYSDEAARSRLVVLALCTLGYTLVMVLLLGEGGPKAALVGSALGFGLGTLWTAWPARVHAVRTGNPFSRYMFWALIVLGLAHTLRLQGAFTPWGQQTFIRDLANLVLWTTIFIMGILRYVLYIAMRMHQQFEQTSAMVSTRAVQDVQKALDERLAHLERQRSLGIMSTVIGHELKQPLTAILLNAQTGLRRLKVSATPNPELMGNLNRVVEATVRANQIIDRVRTFIQPAATEPERVSVSKLVDDVCELIQPQAQAMRVELIQEPLNPDLCTRGDAVQLSQVLLNLLRNALEAMEDAAVRQVRIQAQRDGGRVQISVIDTGIGLSKEQLAHAGDAFFTTKSYGLGMGLSISRSIVERFGGQLRLSNGAGGGAVVMVDLPLAHDPGADARP